jgi:hypothetical protein
MYTIIIYCSHNQEQNNQIPENNNEIPEDMFYSMEKNPEDNNEIPEDMFYSMEGNHREDFITYLDFLKSRHYKQFEKDGKKATKENLMNYINYINKTTNYIKYTDYIQKYHGNIDSEKIQIEYINYIKQYANTIAYYRNITKKDLNAIRQCKLMSEEMEDEDLTKSPFPKQESNELLEIKLANIKFRNTNQELKSEEKWQILDPEELSDEEWQKL